LVISAAGEPRTYEQTSVPIPGRDGATLGSLVVLRDVTEHRQTQQQLRAIDEERRSLLELYPPRLDQVGLASAVEHYARETGEQAGFSVHVEDHLDGRVPVELQVIAYRIIQEALANVRAHANAHHVAIW
jgi:signal transduction histidine kinase